MADVRMTVQTQLEAMNVHALTPNYHSPGINILVKVHRRTQLSRKSIVLITETPIITLFQSVLPCYVFVFLVRLSGLI